MDGIMKLLLLSLAILFIYQINCDGCSCDGFDCRPFSWDPLHNGWSYLNESSRISTISGKGDDNTSIIVNGPCNVHFNWEISSGFNELIFLDNGNYSDSIPRPIPIYLNAPHSIIKNSVKYLIKDNLSHELKWVHRNPHSQGTAMLTNIYICNSFSFKNVKTNPLVGSKGIDFIYSVEVDSLLPSFDVELLVTPPNTSYNKEISQGVVKYNQSNKLLKWGPIRLNCTSFGMGTYYFKVGSPINSSSKTFLGPYIPICIISNSDSVDTNRSVSTYKHCIEVFSCINATIEPVDSDPNTEPKSLISNDKSQSICWNNTDRWPPGVEYNIRG